MRTVDRILQRWRGQVARGWVPAGARVLDIGCHQGEFLQSLGRRIGPSVGMDPLARPGLEHSERYRLLAEPFRSPLPFAEGTFDAVVMLATLEHVRDKEPLAAECRRVLRPGGRVIVTVPSPAVDAIVAFLRHMGLADGMSLDEHHGFDPRETPEVFGRHGFGVEHSQRFQLGLNHLYVLRGPGGLGAGLPHRGMGRNSAAVASGT